jgi:hypothetical protein
VWYDISAREFFAIDIELNKLSIPPLSFINRARGFRSYK